VNNRWLGGMLTNFNTVHKRLERLKELEDIDYSDVAGSGMTKKELLTLRREKDKLEATLGGIRNMDKVPSAIWVVDTNKEHIAVKEARKLGIPVIAILDTNCDPDEVDYAVPGNDDAIRAVGVLTRVVADAVADGLQARVRAQTGEEAEPLAEWETEVLTGAADAAAAEQPVEAAPQEASADSAAEAAPAEQAIEPAPQEAAIEAPPQEAAIEAAPAEQAIEAAPQEAAKVAVADES
jgi:small subunit ribosomal protein S2